MELPSLSPLCFITFFKVLNSVFLREWLSPFSCNKLHLFILWKNLMSCTLLYFSFVLRCEETYILENIVLAFLTF